MTREFDVRPYQDGDEEGILDLFNRVFAEGNPAFEPRTREHWYWQFRDAPYSHQTFVATAPDGRIIGSYAGILGRWLHLGADLLGVQAVDTCIDAAYRRGLKREGVFLTLARAWIDHFGRPGHRFALGFPNPVAFRIGTKLLDYRPVHTPVRALVRDFADDWIEYLGPMGAERVQVVEEDALPAATQALFETSALGFGLVQVRDRRWLEWRYLRCPSIRYRVFAARRDGVLRGVLFMREGWLGKPLAPLVDWVVHGSDVDAFCGLARAAALCARAAGKRRLETWVPLWSDHARSLMTIGFAPDDSGFNQCIRVFGAPFDEDWATRHWFTTMGDSDVY